MSSRSRNTLLILAVIACFGALAALGLLRFYTAKPPPVAAGVHYGDDKRQVLDIWLAKSPAPTPLVVFIHGGGFLAGDKSVLDGAMLRGCLAQGYSVAAINYRFAAKNPLPGPMLDAARAVQFLKSKAQEWNLNPQRVALIGSSAGAGISLWLAYHSDLAQPDSADPVARQSTRPCCALVWDAQTSYDIRFFRRVLGGHAAEHPSGPTIFGLRREDIDTPAAYRLYEECSPIEHVRAGAPPVFLFYSDSKTPLAADSKPGAGMHHPAFGPPLKERVDAIGGVCILKHRDDYALHGGSFFQDASDFLKTYLR